MPPWPVMKRFPSKHKTSWSEAHWNQQTDPWPTQIFKITEIYLRYALTLVRTKEGTIPSWDRDSDLLLQLTLICLVKQMFRFIGVLISVSYSQTIAYFNSSGMIKIQIDGFPGSSLAPVILQSYTAGSLALVTGHLLWRPRKGFLAPLVILHFLLTDLLI